MYLGALVGDGTLLDEIGLRGHDNLGRPQTRSPCVCVCVRTIEGSERGLIATGGSEASVGSGVTSDVGDLAVTFALPSDRRRF